MQQRYQVLYQTQELHPCTGLWSRAGMLKMWGTAGTSGRWLASRGEFILHLNLGWVWCWFVCPPAAPTAEVHVHMSKAGSSFGGQQLASVWSSSYKMWKQRRFGNRVCRRGREEKVSSESGEWLATGECGSCLKKCSEHRSLLQISAHQNFGTVLQYKKLGLHCELKYPLHPIGDSAFCGDGSSLSNVSWTVAQHAELCPSLQTAWGKISLSGWKPFTFISVGCSDWRLMMVIEMSTLAF